MQLQKTYLLALASSSINGTFAAAQPSLVNTDFIHRLCHVRRVIEGPILALKVNLRIMPRGSKKA